MFEGKTIVEPAQTRQQVDALLGRAIQAGEEGLIASLAAGLDQALWDLIARRQWLPLWRLLGGATDTVPVYASSMGPDEPLEAIER